MLAASADERVLNLCEVIVVIHPRYFTCGLKRGLTEDVANLVHQRFVGKIGILDLGKLFE